MQTIADVKWDDEHQLFKGNWFGHWKFKRRKYTLLRGTLAGGGYSIGGKIDGEYQEIDVETEEEINQIMREIQEDG